MYTPHVDVDDYLKCHFITVQSLINMCFTSKKDYDWCHFSQYWERAFKNEHLPLFEPYPTTIKGWIKRYKATMKVINLLNMHNLYLSHFSKDKIEEDLKDLLVIYDVDDYYKNLYSLPLPKSFLSNLGDNFELDCLDFNIYTFQHIIQITNAGGEVFADYDITDEEIVLILIKIVEETNLNIDEAYGYPFDQYSLEKTNQNVFVKERLEYIKRAN